MSRKIVFIWLFVFVAGKGALAQTAGATFTNPLLPSGADPFSFYKDGFYYYTHTTGNRVDLWKTNNLADLKDGTT